MHATIRRYEGVDMARTDEVTGKVNENSSLRSASCLVSSAELEHRVRDNAFYGIHEQEMAVPTPSSPVDGTAGPSSQRTTPPSFGW